MNFYECLLWWVSVMAWDAVKGEVSQYFHKFCNKWIFCNFLYVKWMPSEWGTSPLKDSIIITTSPIRQTSKTLPSCSTIYLCFNIEWHGKCYFYIPNLLNLRWRVKISNFILKWKFCMSIITPLNLQIVQNEHWTGKNNANHSNINAAKRGRQKKNK